MRAQRWRTRPLCTTSNKPLRRAGKASLLAANASGRRNQPTESCLNGSSQQNVLRRTVREEEREIVLPIATTLPPYMHIAPPSCVGIVALSNPGYLYIVVCKRLTSLAKEEIIRELMTVTVPDKIQMAPACTQVLHKSCSLYICKGVLDRF